MIESEFSVLFSQVTVLYGNYKTFPLCMMDLLVLFSGSCLDMVQKDQKRQVAFIQLGVSRKSKWLQPPF